MGAVFLAVNMKQQIVRKIETPKALKMECYFPFPYAKIYEFFLEKKVFKILNNVVPWLYLKTITDL
jgi:hypothetical protein